MKAVFFDRDGVLNKAIVKNSKPFSPRKFEEFQLMPDVETLISSLKEAGFVSIVVTNQPDIARGLMETFELDKMHALIKQKLLVDDISICPHDDIDYCHCRKPKPGMLLDAAQKWNIDLNKSFLIGDTWKDMEAGKVAGCKTILIDAPYNQGVECDRRVNDLKEALTIVNNISNGG